MKEYRKSCSDKEQSEKVYHITAELKLNQPGAVLHKTVQPAERLKQEPKSSKSALSLKGKEMQKRKGTEGSGWMGQ